MLGTPLFLREDLEGFILGSYFIEEFLGVLRGDLGILFSMGQKVGTLDFRGHSFEGKILQLF